RRDRANRRASGEASGEAAARCPPERHGRPRGPRPAHTPSTPPAGGFGFSQHLRPPSTLRSGWGEVTRRTNVSGASGFVLLDCSPARAKRGAMRSPVGVLCSGGLDSAVLLVDLA